MENIQNSVQREERTNSIPKLDQQHGYFASATVTSSPAQVFAICSDTASIKKVLEDLPSGIKNFLDLSLLSSEKVSDSEHRIIWQNSPKATAGTLTLLLKAAPLNHGTIITSEAHFEKIKFKEEGPSALMNIFLKRLKALIETGVLATTTGQPSGREEITTEDKKLH